MATKTTDTKRQLDEFGVEIPTEEELAKERADQEAERIRTERTLNLAMTGMEGQLSGTLPTQPAPVQPSPTVPTGGRWSPPAGVMAEAAPVQPPTMPIGAAPTMINRGGQPSTGSPLVAPPSAPQGRSYMGPAMSPEQEAAFMKSPAGTNVNLMPPPSGPPPSRLERAQAIDAPGNRTIGIHDEPPYSDASMANQQNMMRYNAMKKFDAGDRSPETMAAAMGSTGRMGSVIPKQTFHNVSGAGYSFDPTTGKANLVTPPSAPNARETLALEREKRLAATADQQLSPASKEKVKQMGLDIAGLRGALMKPGVPNETQRQYMSDIATLNSMIADEFKNSKQASPASSPTPVQASASATSKKRVKVIGPSGKKGSVEEGDSLPAGWKLAQ